MKKSENLLCTWRNLIKAISLKRKSTAQEWMNIVTRVRISRSTLVGGMYLQSIFSSYVLLCYGRIISFRIAIARGQYAESSPNVLFFLAICVTAMWSGNFNPSFSSLKHCHDVIS